MLDWGWIVVPFEVLLSRYAYLVLRLISLMSRGIIKHFLMKQMQS